MGIISLAFLRGLGYLGYVTYQNAQTKHLREAIAYEGVSRYEEAIAFCISAGYKASNPLVAEFIYKIAKTNGMAPPFKPFSLTLMMCGFTIHFHSILRSQKLYYIE